MPTTDFLLGEFRCTIDDRHRISIPKPLAQMLTSDSSECILAKERPGALSLWNASQWQTKLERGVALVKAKMEDDRLRDRLEDVQLLGRLLSTRHDQ